MGLSRLDSPWWGRGAAARLLHGGLIGTRRVLPTADAALGTPGLPCASKSLVRGTQVGPGLCVQEVAWGVHGGWYSSSHPCSR